MGLVTLTYPVRRCKSFNWAGDGLAALSIEWFREGCGA
jgi:hypothetical protein